MPSRRRLLARLLLFAFVFTGIEQTLVHTTDGHALETHCDACLLQLATVAVVAPVYSPPPAVLLGQQVPSPPAAVQEQTEPRHLPSRGPPTPSATFF